VPKPPSRRAVVSRRDGVHPIAAMEPLPLDPVDVNAFGVVRAAFDAVHNDDRVNAIKHAAKAESQKSFEQALAASANLARRTATAYVKSVSAFVKPEALPPF
jgi:hypothetical protein